MIDDVAAAYLVHLAPYTEGDVTLMDVPAVAPSDGLLPVTYTTQMTNTSGNTSNTNTSTSSSTLATYWAYPESARSPQSAAFGSQVQQLQLQQEGSAVAAPGGGIDAELAVHPELATVLPAAVPGGGGMVPARLQAGPGENISCYVIVITSSHQPRFAI